MTKMEDPFPIPLSALYPPYPLALASVYLLTSITLRARTGRVRVQNGQSTVSQANARVIWWLLVFFTIALVFNILGMIYGANQKHQCISQPSFSTASLTGVFLFFAASLLPDPDAPYRPSPTCSYTLATALIFESALALDQTVQIARSSLLCSRDTLTTSSLALAYSRIIFLSVAWATLVLGKRKSAAELARESLMGAAGVTERGYGTIEKAPDAQSTDWLDYLLGLKEIFPLIWPTGSTLMQLRAIVCLVILVAQRIVNALVPLQLGRVVAALGKDRIPYTELSIYVVCRAIQGQQGVLASIRAMLWIPFGQATYRKLTEQAFQHVLSLSLEFHLGKRQGEVMSAMNKGSSLNTFLDSLIFQLFPMVADIGVAAASLLVAFDPFYSLIIVTVGGLYLFVTIYMARYRGRARRHMVLCDREMDAIKSDAIMAYDVVHYNSAMNQEHQRLSSHITSFQTAEFSVLMSLNLLNTVQNLIFTIGVGLVCFLSAYNISTGAEEVPLFVTLVAYLAQLQAPLGFFGSFYTQIQNNLIDAERMLALFHEQPTVVDKPGATPLTDCKGHIQLQAVAFGYDPRRLAVRDITLDMRPGQSIAIVGESGSGKSTLLRLLFRFYNVSKGRILIDGRPVDDITIDSLRHYIGVVPQETMLFNDTLMYNLCYVNPSATEEEIYAACRAASVHDKIMSLPDGYQTRVGERGLRLSGGEKQRIAIARVLLKSPRILLLDEATASLDSETEKSIQASLARISVGRTTITIAHRLSTITSCDEIVVLHEGRIVEQGTHSSLLQRQGRYWHLWDKQTKQRPLRETES